MASDPFAGLSDTVSDRKAREAEFRRQKWRAFWASLGAVVIVTAAAAAGGAFGGGLIESDSGNVIDRLLGGTVCGLVGGVASFLYALYRAVRRSVVSDMFGTGDSNDMGTSLYWSAVAGAGAVGSGGATLGLTGAAGFSKPVWACAAVAVLVALIPAYILRGVTVRKARSVSHSAAYRSPQ